MCKTENIAVGEGVIKNPTGEIVESQALSDGTILEATELERAKRKGLKANPTPKKI